eukprot:3695465-Heterocapsa_arctica.AAC.1
MSSSSSSATSPHLLLRRAERTSRFAFHGNRFRAQRASHRHVRLLRSPRAGSSTGSCNRLLLRVWRVERSWPLQLRLVRRPTQMSTAWRIGPRPTPHRVRAT